MTKKMWNRRSAVAALAALATVGGVAVAVNPAIADNSNVTADQRLGDLTVTLAPNATSSNPSFVTKATAAACPAGYDKMSRTWAIFDNAVIELTHTERLKAGAPTGWGLNGDAINLTDAAELGGLEDLSSYAFADTDNVFEYAVTCASTDISAIPTDLSVKYYSAKIQVAADGTLKDITAASTPTLTATPTVTPTATPTATPTPQRIAGPNRYETAVAVSKEADRIGKPLLLATGEKFADALAAGPAAASVQGTLLLTTPDKLLPAVKDEIARLKPSQIVIVGAEDSVSAAAATDASAAAGLDDTKVARLKGSNRAETAAKIAATFFPSAQEAFVTNGFNFPDAISAASVASITPRPVLLTTPDKLAVETAGAVKDGGITSVHVIGGASNVSAAAEDTLKALPGVTVDRVAGANRYETNTMVTAKYGPATPSTFIVATGNAYPDALVSSMLSAKLGAPLLLVSNACSVKATQDYLKNVASPSFVKIGGPKSVADNALTTTC